LTEGGRKNEVGTPEELQLLTDGLDGHAAYPPAVAQLKEEDAWPRIADTEPVVISMTSWSRITAPSNGG